MRAKFGIEERENSAKRDGSVYGPNGKSATPEAFGWCGHEVYAPA